MNSSCRYIAALSKKRGRKANATVNAPSLLDEIHHEVDVVALWLVDANRPFETNAVTDRGERVGQVEEARAQENGSCRIRGKPAVDYDRRRRGPGCLKDRVAGIVLPAQIGLADRRARPGGRDRGVAGHLHVSQLREIADHAVALRRDVVGEKPDNPAGREKIRRAFD